MMRLDAKWVVVLLIGSCDANIVGEPIDKPDSGSVVCNPLESVCTFDYPAGPYGNTAGEIIQDMSFAGYLHTSPSGAASDSPYRESITFAELRSLGYRYLLMNAAAEWCIPCQQEAQVLPAEYARWEPKGGLVISVLTEDAQFAPATQINIDSWISAYHTNYTMVHDPNGFITNVFAPAAMPVNIMIEADTMRIERVRIGDDPEFFHFFEERLNQGN